MQHRAPFGPLVLLGFFGAFVVACDSGGTTTADAGVATDTGVVPDAGMVVLGPDAGCDPIVPTGCTDAKQCGWTVGGSGEIVTCVDIAAIPKGHEQTCSTSLRDCAAGYSCLQLEGDGNPKCYKVCAPTGNVGCDGVTGTSANYACQALAPSNNQPPYRFGVCIGGGASCEPYQPNDCMANETCTIRANNTTCRTAGTAQLGGSCSVSAPCAHGLICLPFNGLPTPVCFQACDKVALTCPTATDRCLPLMALDFGVCQPSCDPISDMCPTNQVCSLVAETTLACATAGTSSVGASCSGGSPACARGGICLLVETAPTCYQPCSTTGANTCPNGIACTGLQGVEFGICFNPPN